MKLKMRTGYQFNQPIDLENAQSMFRMCCPRAWARPKGMFQGQEAKGLLKV
jgi:hypothetical protein